MTNAELIGTPFAYGGRGPDAFDCYGLCLHMFQRDFGMQPPDYGVSEDLGRIQALMTSAEVFWTPLPYAKKGALVLFRVGRFIAHCGVVVSDSEFLHTWEKSGGVVKERLEPWKNRIVGFYEYSDTGKPHAA